MNAKETCPLLPDHAQFLAMKRFVYLLPALSMMGLIFWMSCHPAPESLRRFPSFAGIKVVHLIEYGSLAILWVWGLANATQWIWRKIAIASILIPFLWGISDEIHQAFVPGRTARVEDALTNLLAACLAVEFTTFIRGRKLKLCYKSGLIKDEKVL